MTRTAGPALAFALLVAACGGEQKPNIVQAPEPPAPKPVDVAHEYEPQEVHGELLEPQVSPSMPAVEVSSSATVESQRHRVERVARRPAARRAPDVHALVSLLWAEAQGAKDEEARALRVEARDALRALAEAYRDKPDELTLDRLAVTELTLGDLAAASRALEKLVSTHPEGPRAATRKAWLALALTRQGQADAAAGQVAGLDPSDPALPAEAAYALAWVRFLGGDDEAARTAIAAAGTRWSDERHRAAFDRDLVLILSRTGTAPDAAAEILTNAAGDGRARHMQLVFNLAQKGYFQAGRFKDAAGALDLIFDEAIPSDKVAFRYQQAQYEYRLQRPRAAAERAIQAVDLLKACEACPAQMRDLVNKRLLNLGMRLHGVYAKTHEEPWREAAAGLYSRYLEENGADAEKAKGYLANLDADRNRAAAGQAGSEQSKQIMKDALAGRHDAFVACYERVLSRAPDLAGDLTLTLVVSQEGKVTRATTEPPAGDAGIPAVAGCVADRAGGWAFPSRKIPGETTLVWPMKLSVATGEADDLDTPPAEGGDAPPPPPG